MPADVLKRPLVVLRIRDRVTGEQRPVRSVAIAVEIANSSEGIDLILKDWELLERLNDLTGARGFRAPESLPPAELSEVERALDRGVSVARERVVDLGLPFRFPEVEPIALLWPAPVDAGRVSPSDEDEDYADSAEVLAWVRNQTVNDVVIATAEKLLDRVRTLEIESLGLEDALSTLSVGAGNPGDAFLALERLAQTGVVRRVFIDRAGSVLRQLTWDEVLSRLGGAEGLAGEKWREGARTMVVRWVVEQRVK
jgi:hypothetical protein